MIPHKDILYNFPFPETFHQLSLTLVTNFWNWKIYILAPKSLKFAKSLALCHICRRTKFLFTLYLWLLLFLKIQKSEYKMSSYKAWILTNIWVSVWDIFEKMMLTLIGNYQLTWLFPFILRLSELEKYVYIK